MLDIRNILKKTRTESIITESGADGHMPHLFEQGNLTFGEIKDIFKKLFSNSLDITEKTDGQNLNITYKDGQFKVARNKRTLKNPMDIKELGQYFKSDNKNVNKAFTHSMSDLSKALKTIDPSYLEKTFKNGKSFLSFEIIHPSTRNVINYGNKCLIILHGLNEFDDDFNLKTQNKNVGQKIYSILKNQNAIEQNEFTISGPIHLKLAKSSKNKECLNKALKKLDELIDGFGYNATIADYAKERLIKYIVNLATKRNLNIRRNSDFVSELADRISTVSGRRPTKSDLLTYAKKDGIDYRSEKYRNFIEYLDLKNSIINDGVIKPLEDLIVYVGMELMKRLNGCLALDKSKYADELRTELSNTITEFDNDSELTPKKRMRFKRNLEKLERYGDKIFPMEGIVFTYKGKCYKLTGNFGAVNQILGIFRYKK